MNTGTKTRDRIIRHGKLTAAAHASAVWRSLRASAIHSPTWRSRGNVLTVTIAIAIAARAQVSPNRVKNVPESLS